MNLRSSARPHTKSSTTVAGGREDCWSEGATAALIDAWGDRYLGLNRGNLRQKDWQEVSNAVNRRDDGVKPRKTDVQCKNRIDTLKKKYKVEKAKAPTSRWPFFYRLDSLIGASSSASKKAAALSSSVKPKTAAFLVKSSFDDFAEEFSHYDEVRKENRVTEVGLSGGAACRELAMAILKFGEIYEGIEISKQRQIMELEKQRMEFTRDLDFQRLNMFIDTQLKMEKLKRRKLVRQTGKKQK